MQAGITVESLSLSPAEQRAYPRWYTDLLLRKRHDTVAVGDLLRFVDNFGIAERDKQRISSFLDQPLVVIEPVQFYIFLRLCGHLLQGQQLRKELAYVSAPVPKPRPILSKRKKADDNNPFAKAPKNDMDSFMSLMGGTTQGGSTGKPHKKRVTFDAKPPEVAEAAQRSMQELMRQRALAPQPLVSPAPQPPSPAPQQQQQEPEPDVPIPQNQFAKVNIDSVLHNGHGSIPNPPPPRKLTPNMTGPGQMVQMGAIKPGESLSDVLHSQQTGQAGNNQMQPQLTGQLTGQSSGQLQTHITGHLQPQASGQLHNQSTGQLATQPGSYLQTQSTGSYPQVPSSGHLQAQSTGHLQSTGQPQRYPSPLQPFLQSQSTGNGTPYLQNQQTGGAPANNHLHPSLGPTGHVAQGSPSLQPQSQFSSGQGGHQQFPLHQPSSQASTSSCLQPPQVPFGRPNSGSSSPGGSRSNSFSFNQQQLGTQSTGYAPTFAPQQLQPQATAAPMAPQAGGYQYYPRPAAQLSHAQQPQFQSQSQPYQTYPQPQHSQMHQNTSYLGQQPSLSAQFQGLSISPMPTGQPHPQMQQMAPQQYQQQQPPQQQYQSQYYGGVQVPPPPPRRNF